MKKYDPDKVLLTRGKIKTIIDKNDVLLMTADAKYTFFNLKGKGIYHSTKCMAECCRIFKKKYLWRFCRKYAINMNYFKQFNVEKKTIVFTEDFELELTVKQSKAFNKFLSEKIITV